MAGQIIIFTVRDANDKRYYFNKTVYGKKKEAEKYLRAKLLEQDLGLFVEFSDFGK